MGPAGRRTEVLGPRPGRAEQSGPAERGPAGIGAPTAGPASRLGGGAACSPGPAARRRRLTWALVPGLFRLSTAVPSAMTIVTAAPGPGCGGAGRGEGPGERLLGGAAREVSREALKKNRGPRGWLWVEGLRCAGGQSCCAHSGGCG